jgi:hypothetical protein
MGRTIVVFFLLVNGLPAQEQPPGADQLRITEEPTAHIAVSIGDQLFTKYDFSNYAKPIFYPVYGPGQIPMTRNFPMKKTGGESADHPHHKSIWTGHIINGIDFWSETGGHVKQQSSERLDNCSFRVRNDWVSNRDGSIVVTDTATYQFGYSNAARWIDATIEFNASHGDVTFDDTKEGMFAIRMHPHLQLTADPASGASAVVGNAINSNGTGGKEIWGQAADWVYYFGKIENQPAGIAIFDHPSNLRHPTTWHAREYGLVAANPFGLHAFQGKPLGAGAHKLRRGDSIQFRYRLLFLRGAAESKEIEAAYRSYVDGLDR